MRKQAIVFFSGGVDSWIHLNWAIKKYGKENVKALYFDFGQSYRDKELRAVKLLGEHLGIEVKFSKDLDWLGSSENLTDAHIPLRNVFMLLAGTLWSIFNEFDLVFGMLKKESSEDKNPQFIRMMQKLIDSQNKANLYRVRARKIRIVTPFAHMTKTKMIEWYLREGFPKEPLLKTVGCYTFSHKDIGCGHCVSCFNRWVAFTNNGLSEMYFAEMPYDWAWRQLKGMIASREEGVATPPVKLAVLLHQVWHKRHWIVEVYKAFKTVGIQLRDGATDRHYYKHGEPFITPVSSALRLFRDHLC